MAKRKITEDDIAWSRGNTKPYTGYSFEWKAIVFQPKGKLQKHDLEHGLKEMVDMIFEGGRFKGRDPQFTTRRVGFAYNGRSPGLNPLKVRVATRMEIGLNDIAEYSAGLFLLFPIEPTLKNEGEYERKCASEVELCDKAMMWYARRFARPSSLLVEKAREFGKKYYRSALRLMQTAENYPKYADRLDMD